MKSILLAALCFTTSCFVFAQEVTVSGNSKLNTDFSKYKTYSWAQTNQQQLSNDGYEIYSYAEKVPESLQENNQNTAAGSSGKKTTTPVTPGYIYSYTLIIPASNAAVNTAVKSAIASEMEGRGYKSNVASPDLLVVYKVLERKGRLKGYLNDDPTMVGSEEVRTAEDTVTYDLEPGTLIISLVDTKTSENVWEGFASGLVDGNAFTADPAKLKQAVHMIFDEFNAKAGKKNEEDR